MLVTRRVSMAVTTVGSNLRGRDFHMLASLLGIVSFFSQHGRKTAFGRKAWLFPSSERFLRNCIPFLYSLRVEASLLLYHVQSRSPSPLGPFSRSSSFPHASSSWLQALQSSDITASLEYRDTALFRESMSSMSGEKWHVSVLIPLGTGLWFWQKHRKKKPCKELSANVPVIGGYCVAWYSKSPHSVPPVLSITLSNSKWEPHALPRSWKP